MPLSRTKLVFRNLRHFRAANLAILAGMAVATAVLAGALMVGDSVRGSLRDLAERRLDWVDHAMVSPRMTQASLAQRLASLPAFKEGFETVVPGITLRGGATAGDHRTAGVQITALPAGARGIDKGVAIVNDELVDALAGSVGGPMEFSLPAPEDTPRDATLGRRAREDMIGVLKVPASRRAPANTFFDLFNLTGSQRTGKLAWVNLTDLQENLEREDQANLFLVGARKGGTSGDDAARLNALVRQVATPADYGLSMIKSKDGAERVIVSSSTYIHPAVADAAARVAAEMKLPLRTVSAYLINRVARPRFDRPGAVHYAIAAGVSDVDGVKLGAKDVVINQWLADQLGLKVGGQLRLEYYQRQPDGVLKEVASDRPELGLVFNVAKILPLQGLGADPTLTPEYKGLTDADSISRWNEPRGLTIDRKLVTKADEDYWDKYRAAPKLLVSLEAARALWGSPYGDLTSLRVPADKADEFLARLTRAIDPQPMGLVFRPIKAQQIAAASGGTDFGMLFIGFSLFLVVSAVVLVAMLFRLSVESRARQLGVLAACGLSPGSTRNLCLLEGFLLALAGGLIGLGGALGYTALMVYGLRTWWVDAIGTTALSLHVQPLTLAIGLAGGLAVAMLAVLWGVRKIRATAPATLLAGGMGAAAWRLPTRARASSSIATLAVCAAIGLFFGSTKSVLSPEIGFLGGGAALLLALLTIAFARLRPRHRYAHGLTLADLALKNATRNRARSVLCITLIALASFIIVTVSSMHSSVPRDTFAKDSGAGGYALIVQTDIPLTGDLNTVEGRKLMMRKDAAEDPRWEKRPGSEFTHSDKPGFLMMRNWAGQDVSCLNITRPDSPTILSVPATLRKQDRRFNFARQIENVGNPFTLLDLGRDTAEEIPFIADDETARYILKIGLGEILTITDSTGRPRKLKLVATLKESIFQSELLVSEQNFHRLFPTVSGFSTVLVDVAPDRMRETTELLNQVLNDTENQEKTDYSASIESTASRIQAFHQVRNTYLATFQVLGSLGLMLGTIGMAVVLVRNLVERRAELALLSSLGVGPQQRWRLVLVENLVLLLGGLVIGAGTALAGVIPMTRNTAYRVNVPALSLALSAVLVVGIGALIVAVGIAGRRVNIKSLRAE